MLGKTMQRDSLTSIDTWYHSSIPDFGNIDHRHSVASKPNNYQIDEETETKEHDDEHDDAEDDFCLEPFEFANLDLELVPKSTATRIFRGVVAIVAALDFAAALLDEFWHPPAPSSVQPRTAAREAVHHMDRHDSATSFRTAALHWILGNKTSFGLLFSFLWFVHSFAKANRERLRFSRYLKLLQTPMTTMDDKKNCDMQGQKIGALLIYIFAVSIQLLLLPVGFYIFIYNIVMQTVRNGKGDPLHRIVLHHDYQSDCSKSSTCYTEFSTNDTISLLHAITIFFAKKFSWRTYRHVRKYTLSSLRTILRSLIFFAVRNPKTFRQRVRAVLNASRWANYLAPVGGGVGKLVESLDEFAKKRRQRQLARDARIKRIGFRSRLPPDARRRHSALQIQAAYRAHLAKRRFRALNRIQSVQKIFASLKLQGACRRWLRRSRYRMSVSCNELLHLQGKLRQENCLTLYERLKLYLIRDDFINKTSRLMNRDLLLRPDSNLAISWSILLLVAALFDVIELACKPVLEKQLERQVRHPLTTQEFLQYILVPKSVNKFAVCHEIKPSPGNLLHKLARILRELLRKIKRIPRNCDPDVVVSQSINYAMIKFFTRRFSDFVCAMLFLDVFVQFFTGEIDVMTGALVPAPFIRRWLIPGLFFQLAGE